MVELSTFLEEVSNRQNTFDALVSACLCRKDYCSAMAYYADLFTSSYGEKWDYVTRALELDNIFESLKKLGVMFKGRPISERRTDKEDPYVIKSLATVPNKKTSKNPDGTKTVYTAGTKQVTKRKHVHSETYELFNSNKCNIYGIPHVSLNGRYMQKKNREYVTTHGNLVKNTEGFLRICEPKRATKEIFEKAFTKQQLHAFYNEIDVRKQYGLANLCEIIIDVPSGCALTTGLLRADYDIVNDIPCVVNIQIAFLLKPLIKAHMTNTAVVTETKNYLQNCFESQGFLILPECRFNVITPENAEGADGLVAQLSSYNNFYAEKLKRAHSDIEKRKLADKLAEEHEREQALKQMVLKEENRRRLQAEREQERKEKAAKKAEQRAEQKNKANTKAAEKHKKVLTSTMQQIVADLLAHGVTPTKEVYQNIMNNIQANEQNKDAQIVCEALTILINTDTSQADAEVAELLAASAE